MFLLVVCVVLMQSGPRGGFGLVLRGSDLEFRGCFGGRCGTSDWMPLVRDLET